MPQIQYTITAYSIRKVWGFVKRLSRHPCCWWLLLFREKILLYYNIMHLLIYFHSSLNTPSFLWRLLFSVYLVCVVRIFWSSSLLSTYVCVVIDIILWYTLWIKYYYTFLSLVSTGCKAFLSTTLLSAFLHIFFSRSLYEKGRTFCILLWSSLLILFIYLIKNYGRWKFFCCCCTYTLPGKGYVMFGHGREHKHTHNE